MKKYDAVIAGYTCADLIPEFRKDDFMPFMDLFKPGRLIEIEGISFLPGGIVANTGIAMKKLNKKVFLNGLIGNDFIGNILNERFTEYGLSEGIVSTDQAGTAVSIVIAPVGVDRIFLESTGCNQIFDASFINFNAISKSRLFHFGYPPLLQKFFRNNGSLLYHMFSEIQSMGVVTSMDFSLPFSESEAGKINWPEIMKRVLPVTDIFTPSLEEVLQIIDPGKFAEYQNLYGKDETIDQILIDMIRELGKRIIDSGVKILLMKAAHRGTYLITGDISIINDKSDLNLAEKKWNYRELWCDAYHADDTKIINSNGAGDTAVAAFLSAILNGQSPESSLKYAAIAGRNSLYCNSIYDDLSDWHEMTKQMETEPKELLNFNTEA